MAPKRAEVSATIVSLAADGIGGGPLLAATAVVPQVGHRLTSDAYYDSAFAKIVAAIHYVLPRTSDLGTLNSQLSFRELVFPVALNPAGKSASSFSWTESLTVSGIFIALMLCLSCWIFATRDY
jgi:hypothetical protein